MRARTAILSVALALLAGCSARERANPFDPANPDTGGRPTGFEAHAENTFVRLFWDGSTAPGLTGFELRRRVAGTSEFVTVSAKLSPASVGYVDLGLANGTTYEYRLYHVFADGVGGLPAEDRATPGRARVWVTDRDGRRVHRLTADGRHLALTVSGWSTPNELVVTPSGFVWATDVGLGTLQSLTASGASDITVPGFSWPGAIAVDPVDRSMWVCDETAGLLRHVTSSGTAGSPSSIGALLEPVGVAVDPADRSVWVCEWTGNQVRRFSAAGVQLGATAVSTPFRLAIDSLTRDVWVTSFALGRVVRLTSSVVPADTVSGFAGPAGLAIDHRRGRVWIADAGAGALVALDRAGAEVARVTGLPGVRSVTVDLASGEAWAAVRNGGSTVRVSPDGVVLERATGLVVPWSIVADNTAF